MVNIVSSIFSKLNRQSRAIAVVLALVAMTYAALGISQAAPCSLPVYRNINAPVNLRVKDLLQRMSVEEKARQLDMYAGMDFIDKHADNTHFAPGAQFLPDKASDSLTSLGVGSIHDIYTTPEMYNTIQAWVVKHNRLGIPAMFIEEGLHGFSNSLQSGTVYPESINLASTWDTNLAHQTAAAIASEARPSGVDMLLGPVLDVAREPRWGRIEEDFGEDPYLTGQMGLAYVQGMQGTSLDSDHSVIAEPKHFAGHGSPEGGTNTSPVHAGEREVRTIMLRSFQPALTQGHAMGVMAAYHEIDGIPCAANPWLLTNVLRKEWGFDGFVLSDLGAIRMLYDTHHVAATPGDAVRLAISSGVDMQFYDFDHATFQNAIIGGVRDGKLSPAVLDRAVGRVLRLKFELGLFDHPYVNPTNASSVMRSADHLQLTLKSARESLCLLKNDNLLPLPKNINCITVIGPNAAVAQTGDYTFAGPNPHFVTMLDAIKSLVSPQTKVLYADGSDIAASVALAKQADVVIMALGEHEGISGEGYDRSNLDLPDNQEQLLEAVSGTSIPTVLVLQNGRPLTITWAAQHIPAILEAWYPGEQGGQAIAETLFGDNNPSGHLPISFPRSVGSLPDFYNHDPSRREYYVDGDGTAVFPFGYGLSYTTFSYGNLSATPSQPGKPLDIVVNVRVTNTGQRAGDEVAQLYLHHNASSVETPNIALTGFKRISLNPGQSQVVTFHLTPYDLEIWNADGKWVVEDGDYTVYVGGSSVGGISTQFSLRPVVTSGQDNAIWLMPEDASLHGSQIRITEELGRSLIGYWDNPSEYPSWNVSIPKAGTYKVQAKYSTGHGATAFDVVSAGQTLSSKSVFTSGWSDYKTANMGTVRFTKPGIYQVSVHPDNVNSWGAINLRDVTLAQAGN